MTELERARAHLRLCQTNLRWARFDTRAVNNDAVSDYLAEKENAVLAALSWVWKEQEKEKRQQEIERLELWARRHASLA